MAHRIRIVELFDEREIQELSDVLIDCVEGGAGVSFMLPITRETAESFWRSMGESVAQRERIVVAAEDEDGTIIGTVQVIWAAPENQPHRGDIAKMLVHRRARRQGIGAAILEAAEQEARKAGKTLLVLDTAGDEAARLYERAGWQKVGTVPNFALWPNGDPSPTTFYYKDLT